jgi:hypothetical protein
MPGMQAAIANVAAEPQSIDRLEGEDIVDDPHHQLSMTSLERRVARVKLEFLAVTFDVKGGRKQNLAVGKISASC